MFVLISWNVCFLVLIALAAIRRRSGLNSDLKSRLLKRAEASPET
jgi:hypothetical protein